MACMVLHVAISTTKLFHLFARVSVCLDSPLLPISKVVLSVLGVSLLSHQLNRTQKTHNSVSQGRSSL